MLGTFIFQNNYARYDVDLNTDDLYIAHEGKIKVFSSGSSEEAIHEVAPPIGANTTALAYSKASNKIYVSEANKIKIYGAGDIIPDVRTFKPQIADVGHTSATVRGRVEPAGGEPITSCKVEYGLNQTYSGAGSGEASCTPDPSIGNFTSDTEVSAQISGLTTGSTYHYRFVAGNSKGTNFGIDRTVVPAFVLQVQTLPATAVDTEGATLNGSFDPDGKETSYFFEYGIDDKYGLTIPVDEGDIKSIPGGSGTVAVSEDLRDLPSGKEFHFRIVAFNSDGVTYGPDNSFRVGSPPSVSGVRTSELTQSSATLHANINPVGFDSTYVFEYGTTPSYGQSIPATPVALGSGTEGIDVDQEITDLQPGFTYHFRVVSQNKWGTEVSPDTTFDFAPPSCPNNHVRQQSGASFLPDCRAYELVSPGAAGAVLLYPSNAILKMGQGEEDCCENITSSYYNGFNWALNRGFASSPSRFVFYAGVGVINGLNAPTSEVDIYMSHRTNGGWRTTVPGLTANESANGDQRQCSDTMALCIDHQSSSEQGQTPEDAPYLYTSEGEFRGRLPTNLGVVPGGAKFAGFERMSNDFSHFLFSSGERRIGFGEEFGPATVFTPDGLSTGVGSAYDNDIAERTVEVISRLPGGGDIPTDPGKKPRLAIDFPGVSSDGSHVLMMTPGGGPLKHLYMSIDASLHYEITKDYSGNPVTGEVIGMTRDGSEVLFASKAKVTADDTDNSMDIFKWDETSEENTRISMGNGVGNTDDCSATWEPSGCGARFLTPERAHPNNNEARGVTPAQDDLFAENSGDVYFYSSEILDASRPGIPGQKNLYLYRDGEIQLVTTLDPGTNIQRVQISPDGDHAAFMTKSRLTSYNNKGFATMYTYDAVTGEMECASCNPSGFPPTTDVLASQSGRFMTNDGQTFFSTKDQLVPRDRNGKIIDVYEYVDGRPQLITTGLAGRDFTGGSEVISFLIDPEFTGLEAVSRDGTDVYFSTYETLVGADQNGSFVKFYDARAGGGFDESPQLAPCAAADECHGVDSIPPAPPVIASAESAPGGNLAAEKQKKKKKKQKKKKKKKSKKSKKQTKSSKAERNHG
ncbi:MAG TPA: fibronectin type III domain-containing protein [Solirubrobacterales bacterium]